MINIELTVDEVNGVLAGLGELPAKVSMGLIQKIQKQAAPQLSEQSNDGESEEGAE